MGFSTSLLPRRALFSSIAVPPLGVYSPLSDLDTDCRYCVEMQGLCRREDCRRQVLPQLAKPTGLLRLIGEAHIEQTKRQKPAPSDRVALAKIARRNARKIARSKRRGMFGLLRELAKQ